MSNVLEKYPEPIELLPHRPPLLLIDKIISFDINEGIITEVNITEDLIFFKGHFPQNPILPGVILVEIMFQSCGLFSRLRLLSNSNADLKNENEYKSDGRAIKIDKLTFQKEVTPNTRLNVHAKPLQRVFNFMTFYVEILSGKNKISTGEITIYIKK